ncbi:MAG: Unknown protein [uncultured Sulfurovum sp.]|uniref:Uncharacterized protein n=1 Tax=uncultured Sulfurovum sp. TaxID=269237 RepID=A0A6S6SVY4_9BACT|nr:MAG: Unknown protein [uncultured Sulfurovum sp.]
MKNVLFLRIKDTSNIGECDLKVIDAIEKEHQISLKEYTLSLSAEHRDDNSEVYLIFANDTYLQEVYHKVDFNDVQKRRLRGEEFGVDEEIEVFYQELVLSLKDEMADAFLTNPRWFSTLVSKIELLSHEI